MRITIFPFFTFNKVSPLTLSFLHEALLKHSCSVFLVSLSPPFLLSLLLSSLLSFSNLVPSAYKYSNIKCVGLESIQCEKQLDTNSLPLSPSLSLSLSLSLHLSLSLSFSLTLSLSLPLFFEPSNLGCVWVCCCAPCHTHS